jgi:hypothetical protein
MTVLQVGLALELTGLVGDALAIGAVSFASLRGDRCHRFHDERLRTFADAFKALGL